MESENQYVSSRGILKSCDVYSNNPISSIKFITGYEKIRPGCNLYICGSALKDFIFNYLPLINFKFVLVSGDCDEDMPFDVIDTNVYEKFITDDRLIHWYCQNNVVIHPKITIIPIGLDYHTLTKYAIWGPITSCSDQERILNSIKSNCKHFSERKLLGYANFHFSMNTKHGYDRKEAIDNLDNNLVYYESKKVLRFISWKKQSEFAFCICPHGGGLDCHRNWEALILGCIPIVKTSKIDHLYQDLPVLIVKDWKDVNKSLLEKTISSFKNKNFNYEKLKLNYWISLIKNAHIKPT
jgi:hypothetical protein